MATILNEEIVGGKAIGIRYHGMTILEAGESAIIKTLGYPGLIGVNLVKDTATIDVTSAADTDIVTVFGTSLVKGEAAQWTNAATLAEAIAALSGVKTATAEANVVTVVADSYLVISRTNVAGTITLTFAPAADYMVSVLNDRYDEISKDMHTPVPLENSDISVSGVRTCVEGASAYLVENRAASDDEIKVTWRIRS